MPIPSDLLPALLSDWRALIQGWAASGAVAAAASEALMLEGNQPAQQQLQQLTAQWAAAEFSAIPPIELLSAAEINGAMGAFAASTGRIYLNGDWLLSAAKDQVFAVLTEELGHALDAQLNSADTPGDEGEYFARLLAGAGLSEGEKAALRLQSDAGVVVSGGGGGGGGECFCFSCCLGE